MNKTILIIAAHPDDEVLGCFGTVSRLIMEGYNAYTLILSKGKASRGDRVELDSEINLLQNETKSANNIIGITQVFNENFPDNRFDSVDFLDIVKSIENVKQKVNPSIIFTHFKDDLNIDHRITYDATITATRPIVDECVKEIYSFEILSSTEWNYPTSFSPDTFFDIDNTLSLKLKAMDEYQSELRDYPHPRSIDGIELNAKYQGMRVGLGCAEAFQCIRRII